jgi:tRNA(fMet)-specific endonuclease VapC
MYLFDTDTITGLLKKLPFPGLVKKLNKLKKSNQFISTITISEIVYGAYKSPRPDYHIERLEKILLPAVNILGFDTKASYICGRLMVELQQRGNIITLADLQIASIAIANDLILITGNTKHFKRIETLKIDNWLK